MGLEFELEESDFAGYIPDKDEIRARCTAIKSKTANFVDESTGEKAKRVEFTFVLQGADSNGADQTGTKLWGETPAKFNSHPDNRLRNWAENLVGRRFPKKYRLNTDELLNNECIVVVGYREYESKGQQKKRNDVIDVKILPEKQEALIESTRSIESQVDEEEPF